MKKVKIIADSTCDLSDELLEQYGISVVPLCIVMDGKSYYDKIEVTPDEIYAWAEKNKTTPGTAAIPMDLALQTLEPYVKEGRDVIFLGISEDMSTTCNVMRMAARAIMIRSR